jgi:hypothetical protein
MNLDDAQRQKVTEWIAQGLKLSEIQTRLASELGIRLTYMEVRLLVDDLKLTPIDAEPRRPTKPVLASPAVPLASWATAAARTFSEPGTSAPPQLLAEPTFPTMGSIAAAVSPPACNRSPRDTATSGL